MMTEFYVKVVLASIGSAYGAEQAEDFFALLQCYILEVFGVLEGQERKFEVEALKVEGRKEAEDLEAGLLKCRREIYACFKLLGDLVSCGYAEASLALSILEVHLHGDLTYQKLARTVILACSLGKRLVEPNFQPARECLAETLRNSEGASFECKREQHTSRTLQDDMRDLMNAEEGSPPKVTCEFSARPILRRIYSALFCFSITQPEIPYIRFCCR